MIERRHLALATSVLLLINLPAASETSVQNDSISTSNAANPYIGSGGVQLATGGFFTFLFEPFDTSLGTLVSTTFDLKIDGNLNGTVAAGTDPGNAAGSLGGTFFLNGLSFDGTGGGGGAQGEGGETFSGTFGIPDYQKTLNVADAGTLYNPALLDFLLGEDEVALEYGSPVNISYSNVAELLADVTATFSVTYTYETADGGTGRITVVGVRRNTGAGEVALEWNSSPGKNYRITASAGLEAGTFSEVAASIPADGGATTVFTEDVAPGVGARFYRIEEIE